MTNLAFFLYLLFVCSYFLHLPSRMEFLGAIRFDLVLVVLIGALAWAGKRKGAEDGSAPPEAPGLLPGTVRGRVGDDAPGHGPADGPEAEDPPAETTERSRRVLGVLLAAVVATVPFVEWPGSALNYGIPILVKAVVFYYFTVSLVTTEARLRVFIGLFLACQSFRVVEPAYLHVADGYWGDKAYMMGELMDRLSGAPLDVINPNGLAFVIVSVLPFVYYFASLSFKRALPLVALCPILLYALALTGSRSGFVGLIVMMAAIVLKGRKRALLLTCFAGLVAVAFVNLNADQQDRYASVFDSGARNAGTVQGRWEGVRQNFEVAMRRPVFGHGIGTSREANGHFAGTDKPAHNLYAEIAEETGVVGLAVFVLFMKAVFGNFHAARRKLGESGAGRAYLSHFVDAMHVWIIVILAFSLVSYGFSSYEWYLAGGLSVVARRLAKTAPPATVEAESAPERRT